MKKAQDQYGAALLGVAIRNVFPQVRYLGTTVTPRGFSALFIDNSPFQDGFLDLLDKEIQKLHKQAFEVMEMMGENAMEMLIHHGQPSPKPLSGPIFISKVGSYYEPCEGVPEKAEEVTLLGFEQVGNQVRVDGKSFDDHLSKQKFKRLYRKWKDYRIIAKELELFDEEGIHTRGVLFQNLLDEIQINYSLSIGFLPVQAPNPFRYAKEFDCDCIVVGGTHYVSNRDAAISSLQMIQKWTNMFGFEGQWFLGNKKPKKDFQQILSDSQICFDVDDELDSNEMELRVKDFLGCYQRVSVVKPLNRGITFTLVEDTKQWMQLLLEKDQGFLPGWLQPEQTRLIVEGGVHFEEVTKKLRSAKMRYTVDRGGAPLKEKMYRALRVNVPYVMVFGKHEEKTDQMTIRALGSRKSEMISLSQLDQFIAEPHFES